MQLRPMGERAMLVDELDDPAGWADAFRRLHVPGVVDVVPAARTVLVVVADDDTLAAVRRVAPAVVATAADRAGAAPVEIPVVYDGPDLAAVAQRIGRSTEEVIELHAGTTYRVAFCGFAPGFAYLDGLPEVLHLPRRETPRTRVPAGSVAIAAAYAAVYPTASPGGWHLLGTTDTVLFDPHAARPALLPPGVDVRFVPR